MIRSSQWDMKTACLLIYQAEPTDPFLALYGENSLQINKLTSHFYIPVPRMTIRTKTLEHSNRKTRTCFTCLWKQGGGREEGVGKQSRAVIQTLSSHQSGPGSIPKVCVIYALSLPLVLALVTGGFSSELRFSPRPQ